MNYFAKYLGSINWTLTLPLIGVGKKISSDEPVSVVRQVKHGRPMKFAEITRPLDNQWAQIRKLREGLWDLPSAKKVAPKIQEKAKVVVPEVKETPMLEEVIPKVDVALKAEKPEKVGVNKSYANLFLSVALAVCFVGFLLAFTSEGGAYKGATVGLPRPTEVAKTEEVIPVAMVSSAPVTQLSSALPYVAVLQGGSYARLSADEVKYKEAITQDAIEKEKSRLRKQEMVRLSDLLTGKSNEIDEIQKRATERVKDIRKISQTKINALHKRGKDKEADRLLAKTDKDVEALLRKSESRVEKIESAMQETQHELEVLLAADTLERAKEDGLLRQANEIRGMPTPQQSVPVAASMPQSALATPPTQRTWKKGDTTVYVENNSVYRLLIYKVVDGKMEVAPRVSVSPGKVQPYIIVDGEVCLQLVKVEMSKNSEIGGHEVFKNDRLFWVFDGEKSERNDKPSPRLYTALAKAGRL